MTPAMRSPVAAALLLLASLLAAPAWSALPSAVDGQPLPSLAPMLEGVTPSVVNIHSRTVVRVRNPLAEDPFFRHFFGMPSLPQQRVQQSLGSGVVVDAERGLVLTNNHVIEGADDIAVTLADGRTLQGEFVGADPDTDVALIRVPAEDLVALPLADTAALRVGDFVVAVGNPFGLGQTVTSGIVSALGRSGLQGIGYQNFIQTDASINPGNSGGALVNLRGELVGINTAIFSPSGGNVGIGFAIPVTLAQEVMRQLLAFGEVRRGSLGIQAQDITPQIAELLKLGRSRGAVVARVLPGSPAERAGLQVGDTIIELEGRPIASGQALHNAEGLLPVEKPVRIRLLRDGREREVSAVLTARPRELVGHTLDERLAGATFVELPEALRRRGVTGVRVGEVQAGSRAASNGLRPGDVLTGLNRRAIADLPGLQQLLAKPPATLLLAVLRSSGAFVIQAE
jgi:serine protease DegQ